MHILKADATERIQLKDEQIVSRILSGEKALFELLMRRNNQKLYRIMRSYLRNVEDIEDAMQETYLKAFRKLDQFRSESSFSTWLIKIGINESLYRLKKASKQRMFEVDTTLETDPKIKQLHDMKSNNPEKIAIGKEIINLIEHAIDALPEIYRIAYTMKEVQGMETAEVCDCLNINETNLKVRIHRARQMMKETLLKLSADTEIFEFGNSRCDAMVNRVMTKIME
jgi:RNA polymerase sigma-70 factor (ECF subfamily)